MQRTLIVMLKEPRPGRVKTRLAKGIGSVAAAAWFRRQALDLIKRLRDPRWTLVLAVSPDKQGLTSRVWPDGLSRVPQGAGDLGARMGRLIRSAPPGPVCVIGADIPGITPGLIQTAFRALGRSDAVFGPAHDGGYWLVGLKRARAVPPTLFNNVRWSSEHALTDTIATLPGHSVTFIQTLRDVDTVEDLAMTLPRSHASEGP